MAAQSYSLRSRLNGQSPSARNTPPGSPATRAGPRSPRKIYSSNVTLQLQKVIGTTTSSPPGLACCVLTNSYAHCAGAVAVLSTVHNDDATTHRYFKSRPTTSSLNPSRSHYDDNSPSTTPSRRRTSVFSSSRARDAENGGSFGREWLDDNNSGTWTARERIKAVSCVALSECGRWLAVGESGYNPRVLLYSTAADAPTDIPTSIVSDHAIGVRGVAFSPDSRYLATLGTLTDGFVYIWSLNSRNGTLTLHSANKCTTNISDMLWCDQHLVTVGTRHVKVWQPGQSVRPAPSRRLGLRPGTEPSATPSPYTLMGHNALLGPLVDSNFTSAVAISPSRVLVGTDAGHLCALDVSETSRELKLLKLVDFEITSLAWQASKQRLALGTRRGIIYEELTQIERMLESPLIANGSRAVSPRKGRRSSTIRQSLGLQTLTCTGAAAVGCLSQHLIGLDTDGNLHIESTDEDDREVSGLTFAAHNDMIQGVNLLPVESDLGAFFTWSRHGDIRFWDTTGILQRREYVGLQQQDPEDGNPQNELKIVRYVSTTCSFLVGDRFGVLQLVTASDWQSTWTGRAHGAEITDAAIFEGNGYVATSSRDQTVQLYSLRGDGLVLVQTMDDHIGAVNHVRFSGSGDKLLSCSADRTIVVRERAQRDIEGSQAIAYLSARVVTMRSAPLSMSFTDDSCEILLVSTMDRHIVKVEPATGTVIETCKIIDPENDDTVALSSIAVSRKGITPEDNTNLLLSISSTDKSLRIYDADKNVLLTRESGHTEGISDLCLLENRTSDSVNRTVISTGLDGTIMLWSICMTYPSLLTPAHELSQDQLFPTADTNDTPVKASPASLPPLRKILSKLDVMEFSKSTGMRSPSSPRSMSPARLVRKKSNLALSTTIHERDEEAKLEPIPTIKRRVSDSPFSPDKSPSPPPSALSKPKKQRSRSEMMDPESRKAMARRSPSPPPMPLSQPTTPRNRTSANNGRLRRPPSVPTDLRAQALAQGRRQSMTQASDFGSMGMATEQACRMLRTYRKKLASSREELNLDELEDELDTIMKIVKDRKETAGQSSLNNTRRGKAKAATENDVDELAILLERANMKDMPGRVGNVKA